MIEHFRLLTYFRLLTSAATNLDGPEQLRQIFLKPAKNSPSLLFAQPRQIARNRFFCKRYYRPRDFFKSFPETMGSVLSCKRSMAI